MIDRDEDVERVREGVELTRAERTAALRFLPSRINVQPSLEERLVERMPALAEGIRVLASVRQEVTSRLQVSEISSPVGRIGFVQDRCLYANGDGGWTLTAPGFEFVGKPGEWERVISEDEALDGEVEPLWLLRLISAAVEAEDKGSDAVLGEPCRRFGTLASFPIAQAETKRPMSPPRSRGNLDYQRLPIEVWLDRAGRIRRAIFYGDQVLTMLELSDFGAPDPIELPAPNEIVPDDNAQLA